jgi:SinI restriction endonuclease
MTFVKNSEAVARAAMSSIDPSLVEKYASLIKFLASFPQAASALRGGASAPAIGSELYIERQATAFASSREPRSPQAPATVPDEMVSVILHEYFGIKADDLDRAKREHLLSMGAENLVGDLLERYLASILEPRGWLWCSGSTVKAVDFVKAPAKKGGAWRMLQVKNRDNSENSSGSAIRLGTDIEKWHRTFSKKEGANWAAFPDPALRQHLSEAAFKAYVTKYLHNLKA